MPQNLPLLPICPSYNLKIIHPYLLNFDEIPESFTCHPIFFFLSSFYILIYSQYPEGYLEAMAAKEKEKEKNNNNSESDEITEKKAKGKRKLSKGMFGCFI